MAVDRTEVRAQLEGLETLINQATQEAIRLRLQLEEPALTEPAEGSVIKFVKRFDSWGEPYTYIAVRIGHTWYLTGRQRKTMSWKDLVAFAGGDDASIEVATNWSTVS